MFELFGVPHVLMLAAIPAVAAILAVWSRENERITRGIRLTLGLVLLVNELIWYGYKVHQGWINFPLGLPLHLCDATLWLTIFTCFSLKPWSFELAYYWGLAGTSMAVLTPDLSGPPFSHPFFQFFLAHGGVITAILFLTWRKQLSLRPGSMWRAFGYLNLFALLIGLFNALFDTNYMFLCERPVGASLLDFMGQWPVYVLIGDVLALFLFFLLWLPLRKKVPQ